MRSSNAALRGFVFTCLAASIGVRLRTEISDQISLMIKIYQATDRVLIEENKRLANRVSENVMEKIEPKETIKSLLLVIANYTREQKKKNDISMRQVGPWKALPSRLPD